MKPRLNAAIVALALSCVGLVAAEPVAIVYDTDIGNDVDDVLALGMIHALQSRGHCDLLAVSVTKDIPSAKLLAEQWPTPVIWSGFEIGITATYPAVSIERDYEYVPHHPLKEAYYLYNPPPHDRPTWDLTSVLAAVWPDRDYFALSSPGTVTVEDDGFTRFKPGKNGKHRFLILDDLRNARLREALVQLCSQPPVK